MKQEILNRLRMLKMLTQMVVDDINRKEEQQRRASTYFNLLKLYSGNVKK